MPWAIRRSRYSTTISACSAPADFSVCRMLMIRRVSTCSADRPCTRSPMVEAPMRMVASSNPCSTDSLVLEIPRLDTLVARPEPNYGWEPSFARLDLNADIPLRNHRRGDHHIAAADHRAGQSPSISREKPVLHVPNRLNRQSRQPAADKRFQQAIPHRALTDFR